jgi:two-component system response regulator RegA
VILVERFFISDGHGIRGAATALVVNTDVRVMQGFANALRAEGYSVFEATSFEDGKQLWRNSKPDVLVVDIRLGQFNGLQLLMRARSDRPDLHAIITCPFPDPVLEAETRRFGGTFLSKPVEPWQIVNAIRGASHQNGSVPEPVTPPQLMERRRSEDRRKVTTPEMFPDRRQADRRRLGV